MPVKYHFWFFVLVFLALVSYGALRDLQPQRMIPLAPISFYDKSDKKVALEAFNGKVVLVNLWATWCVPCIAELPALERLQKALPADKFSVVALSVDTTSMKDIQNFLKVRGIKGLKIYWDKDRQVPLKWKYQGLPTSFLLDRKGAVIKQYDGAYEWDKGATFQDIKNALFQKSS